MLWGLTSICLSFLINFPIVSWRKNIMKLANKCFFLYIKKCNRCFIISCVAFTKIIQILKFTAKSSWEHHGKSQPKQSEEKLFRLFLICPASKEKKELQVTRQVKSSQSSSEWPIITSATLRHTYLIGKREKKLNLAVDAHGKTIFWEKKNKQVMTYKILQAIWLYWLG